MYEKDYDYMNIVRDGVVYLWIINIRLTLVMAVSGEKKDEEMSIEVWKLRGEDLTGKEGAVSTLHSLHIHISYEKKRFATLFPTQFGESVSNSNLLTFFQLLINFSNSFLVYSFKSTSIRLTKNERKNHKLITIFFWLN